MNNRKLLFLATVILAVIILFTLFSIFSALKPSEIPSNVTPTAYPQASVKRQTKIAPQNIQSLPTFSPAKGQGVDVTALSVQASIEEINKLDPYLPFTQDVQLANGQTVSISIPPKNLQNNPWTLTVQIFGIDYNTTPDQPDYQLSKQSFLQAADTVFQWLQSHNANPAKIYISWGDKAYIQTQAESWLKEK